MKWRGLQTLEWRQKLNQQLRRVGYRLGELDETFDDEIATRQLDLGREASDSSNSVELYDLANDIGERNNLDNFGRRNH